LFPANVIQDAIDRPPIRDQPCALLRCGEQHHRPKIVRVRLVSKLWLTRVQALVRVLDPLLDLALDPVLVPELALAHRCDNAAQHTVSLLVSAGHNELTTSVVARAGHATSARQPPRRQVSVRIPLPATRRPILAWHPPSIRVR